MLGDKVRARLLGVEGGLGSWVRIAGKPFKVVGLLEHVGTQLSRDRLEIDEHAWIPISTMQANWPRWWTDDYVVSKIIYRMRDRALMEDTEREVRAILAKRVGVAADDNEAVGIWSSLKLLNKLPIDQTQGLMFVLATATLVIGGIGVLNMMLDAVHERRQEIGVRLAIGARRRDIVAAVLRRDLHDRARGRARRRRVRHRRLRRVRRLRAAGFPAGPVALGARRGARARRAHGRGARGRRDPGLARGAGRPRADAADGVAVDLLRQTLRSLRAHAVRFALTSLGITWGAFVLTYLTASMQGFDKHFTDELEEAGPKFVLVWPGAVLKNRVGERGARPVELENEDVAALSALASIESAAPDISLWSQIVRAGGRTKLFQVDGISDTSASIRNLVPREGRMVSKSDVERAARVVYLGAVAAERLFGAAPAVGRTLQIESVTFRVIGVNQAKGDQMVGFNGWDDWAVFLPYTTAQRWLVHSDKLEQVAFAPTTREGSWDAIRSTREVLGLRHAFPPDLDTALSFFNIHEILPDRLPAVPRPAHLPGRPRAS